MKRRFVFGLVIVATQAWCQPVPGSMDVHWNEGAADCAASAQKPIEVHRYDPQTFILRQSPCAHFEANFLYLLIGSQQALLLDTGAVEDPKQMPLAETVAELLRSEGKAEIPLLVVHTHGHGDHRAGDSQLAAQFGSLAQIVPVESEPLRAFFGYTDWPNGLAGVDLGGRRVDVIPAPGHHVDHLLFYDDRTGVLFSGDFLLPGRLIVDDIAAYRQSAVRIVDFLKTRPLTHILAGHIELDAAGQSYAARSQYHPNERRLEMTRDDLLGLPAALQNFNGFYQRHASYVITNPLHNLIALATAALALLILVVWGVRQLLRRRRATA